MRLILSLVPVTPRFVLLLIAVVTNTASAAPMVLGPHSIVDPAARVGYVMTDHHGVRALVAVDLATGKPRWTSRAGVKPIGARGKLLAALDSGGALRVLDATTGQPNRSCPTIKDVITPFLDQLGTNHSAIGLEQAGKLYLSWTEDTFYAGGAAPSPEMEAAARKHREQTYELDLANCRAIPATVAVSESIAAITKSLTIATATGKQVVIDASALTLRVGDRTIDLTAGDKRRSALSLSRDRRAIMCGDPSGDNFAVFDLDSGIRQAVKLPSFEYLWLIDGDRVVVGGGGALASYSAKTAKLMWSVAESSTHYTGPYPP